MVGQVGALQKDLRAIARSTEELAQGSTAAAAELRAAMARVEQRALSYGDRQLRHFLAKHSYAKALEYPEQTGA